LTAIESTVHIVEFKSNQFISRQQLVGGIVAQW